MLLCLSMALIGHMVKSFIVVFNLDVLVQTNQFIPPKVNSSTMETMCELMQVFNINLHRTFIIIIIYVYQISGCVWTPVDMCYAGQFDLLHSTAIRPILHSKGTRVAASYGFPSVQWQDCPLLTSTKTLCVISSVCCFIQWCYYTHYFGYSSMYYTTCIYITLYYTQPFTIVREREKLVMKNLFIMNVFSSNLYNLFSYLSTCMPTHVSVHCKTKHYLITYVHVCTRL